MAMTSSRGAEKGQWAPNARPNIVVSAFGLIVLVAFSVLYVFRRDIYFAVIDLWSFRPFTYPFIDLLYVPSQINCWHMGIDVYAENPCDPLGRLHDYSPLWLRLSFLGSAKSFLNVLGVSLDGLFMLSLAALPRPRRWIDYLPIMLCVVSPMTVFAQERGNIDTLMFLFAMAAVVCMDRALPVRMLGYGAIMLASLLKFYPFVLFILLLRERLRVFMLGALAAVCVMGGFVWDYWDEIRRMAANIPHPSNFTDAFGSVQLPAGIVLLWQHLLSRLDFTAPVAGGVSATAFLTVAIFLPLVAGTLLIAQHLGRREDLQTAQRALTQRESLCLVAGAVLVCGCFFSGRSIGYREVMILMAIPGLAALVRTSPTEALARIFRITTWVAVFLMFYPVPQRLLYHWLGSIPANGATLPTFVFWLFREGCWWWFIAVLAAILIRFLLDSPVWLAAATPPHRFFRRSRDWTRP
jgi:hypothetical protein